MTRVGETITFSALTVIAALLSLLAATFQIYSQLGIPLAIGIGTMLLAGLTLLPALLAVFGRAAFWPSKTRAGTGKAGLWGRIATRIVRRPAVPLTIGVIVFGALASAVTAYQPGGFGGSITAPAGTDSAAGTALLAKHFPASAANPTNLIYKLPQPVWDNPELVVVATGQLKASGLFTGVTGPLNPVGVPLTPAQYQALHAALGNPRALAPVPPAGSSVPLVAYEAYRATAQYVSPDGETIQFQTGLKAGDPSTTAAMNAVPSIRTEAAAVATTLHATAYGVAGEAAAFYDISAISDSDLLHVVPIAIVVIGLLLCLVIRSLIAPLYLIASVALSYFAALGLSVILFIKIGGSSGLTFILPFLMFIFLLALGEDYNILVMSRIREEAYHLPLREAVSRALAATGTTVTSAGLVLAGTFSVFALVGGRGSGGSQIRAIGVGLALGVLMDTFIVRTILVPCTVVLLGRWNWWPSSSARPGRSRAAPARKAPSETPSQQRRGPPFSGAEVRLGVDGGGQVAQGGRGVAQRGPVTVRQRSQRRLDDVLVHPVPPGHRRRARLGQVQADGAAVAGALGAGSPRHIARRLEPAEQGGHRARRQPEHPGELAWPDPRVFGDAGEQLELSHRKPESGVGGACRAAHGPAKPGHDARQFRADLLAAICSGRSALGRPAPALLSLSGVHLTGPPPWAARLAPAPARLASATVAAAAAATASTRNAGRACSVPAYP